MTEKKPPAHQLRIRVSGEDFVHLTTAGAGKPGKAAEVAIKEAIARGDVNWVLAEERVPASRREIRLPHPEPISRLDDRVAAQAGNEKLSKDAMASLKQAMDRDGHIENMFIFCSKKITGPEANEVTREIAKMTKDQRLLFVEQNRNA